jgi:hypothetical protein
LIQPQSDLLENGTVPAVVIFGVLTTADSSNRVFMVFGNRPQFVCSSPRKQKTRFYQLCDTTPVALRVQVFNKGNMNADCRSEIPHGLESAPKVADLQAVADVNFSKMVSARNKMSVPQ